MSEDREKAAEQARRRAQQNVNEERTGDPDLAEETREGRPWGPAAYEESGGTGIDPASAPGASAPQPSRSATDIGGDSPASGEAKRQSIAGAKGGPQASRETGSGRQPPQSSGRRGARHEQPPQERKSFEAAEDPSQQGEGEPSAEQVKRRSGQQGIDAREGE